MWCQLGTVYFSGLTHVAADADQVMQAVPEST